MNLFGLRDRFSVFMEHNTMDGFLAPFRRAKKYFKYFNDDGFAFGLFLYDTYVAMASQRLRSAHELVSLPSDYFNGFYDNIVDYYKGDVLSPFLDDCMAECNSFSHDPNMFADNLRKHSYYSDLFYQYDKSRKLNDLVLSEVNSEYY